MAENYSDLANLFAKNFKTKYKELINRNSKRLSLCDEKTLEQVRIELLDSEYRLLFSSFGTKKYSCELFEEYNIQGKKYPKANFLQKLQFAKEIMVEFGMSERDRIIEWTNRPDEELVKDMAEYAAWLTMMKHRIEEEDVVFEEDYIEEIEGDNTSNTKKLTLPFNKDVIKFKWTGSEQQLVLLYNLLQSCKNANDRNYFKTNYIDCPDFKLFEKHFNGGKPRNLIKWVKPLYELVNLMDKLFNFIDNSCFSETKDIIKPKVLIEHFQVKRGKGHLELKDQSIFDARSDFAKSLTENHYRQKKAKNIDAIIQALN